MDGAAPVSGRPGPRPKPTNLYEPKRGCTCEDRHGAPAPWFDPATGDCLRCGHPVRSSR